MGKKQKKMPRSDELFLNMREPKNWWERYCSHVLEPGQYVFLSVMLLVVFAGIGIFLLLEFKPLRLEALIRLETAFVDYSANEENERLVFHSDRYPEKFFLAAGNTNLEDAMIRSCGTGEVYTVYAEYFEKMENYQIDALTASDGSVLLSLEETNAFRRDQRVACLGLTGCFLLFWAVFTFGMFYVGAYPERHPWLVRIIYKKSAIYF